MARRHANGQSLSGACANIGQGVALEGKLFLEVLPGRRRTAFD
jgi:hypothetical protein